MTVWTQVSLNELNRWLAARGLPVAHDLLPVEEGVEDSVYRVYMRDGSRTCLRIFERTEPVGPLALATLLAEHGLKSCPPVRDVHGQSLCLLAGKPAALFPWIDGHWFEKPQADQLEQVGQFMGQMAHWGQEGACAWQRTNPRGFDWFVRTGEKLRQVAPRDVCEEIADELSAQKTFWNGKELPRGAIHADLFRNNVLFEKDGALGAVLDWGFCASGEPLIYDLAIAVNDWCLSFEEQNTKLDQERQMLLLRAFEKERPLSLREEKAWPMALRLAALRFYLSRLYDRLCPREPNGKSLDPAHFHEMLRFRQSLA